MDRRLLRIVRNVKETYQSNPPEEGIDLGTLLQMEIVRSGEEFDEADVLKAAEMVGVPEGELISWLEEMASWV